MADRVYHGDPRNLRSPGRVELLEVDRAVTTALAQLRARSVVDVGTGTGLFAEALAARSLEVTGIDVNPAMLELARAHVPGARFVEASFDELPFGDAAFDLAFYGHVLHESHDLARTLREAARVARMRIAALEWPYRQEDRGPPLAHRLSEADVSGAAREAGLPMVAVHHLKHMLLYVIDLGSRERQQR